MLPDLFRRIPEVYISSDAFERVEIFRAAEFRSGEAAVLSYEMIDLSIRSDMLHRIRSVGGPEIVAVGVEMAISRIVIIDMPDQ